MRPDFEEVDRQFALRVAEAQFETIGEYSSKQLKIDILPHRNIGDRIDAVEARREPARLIDQLALADSVESQNETVHRTNDAQMAAARRLMPVLALVCG